MHKLIKELRRREVFRTAGLYVGIAWIAVEVASVLFDAFEAPDWALQAVIIIAVIGLPVTIVLAWIFDITEKGIEVQAEPTDTMVIPFGGRRMDFVVIGVLTVALVFSVYLNVAGNRQAVVEQIEPISVLIADFDNRTGDQLFDGTLEQALQIGIESAPFITGYRRDAAKRIAASLDMEGRLDEAAARLVSVREGVKLVMAGSIEEEDGAYQLYVRAVDPKGGEVLVEVDADAKDKLSVLEAVGTLSGDLREKLGDKSLDREKFRAAETFTAKSLEAAQAYSKAQSLQYHGKYDEAMTFYRDALEHDPNFGRAYSGLALSAFALGREREANELWESALATLDTMTERERLRTLGLYYANVTRNFNKAIETYSTLIEKYPADDAAHNGLAIQYFYSLDFDKALEAGKALLDIYPNNVMGRSNYALYAMYASDFGTAVDEAKKVRSTDPTYFKAWLPIAMNALANGDQRAAVDAYQNMGKASNRGLSTSLLGLSDTAILNGRYDQARSLLSQGIAVDAEANSQYFLSAKYIALAQTELHAGNAEAAVDAAEKAVEMSAAVSRLVPAALIFLETGKAPEAQAIAAQLGNKLQPQSRAYSKLIEGLLALRDNRLVDSIESITAGIELADLWLLRFYRGQAYLSAGYHAEALDEFTACRERHGEATAIFLDDLPTYRYMAELPYWIGRAQEQLGMAEAAQENYRTFIARRPAGGPLADDARQRLP